MMAKISVRVVVAGLLCLLLWPAHAVDDPLDGNFARKLHDQAKVYAREGRYAEAAPLAKRALAIREKILEKWPEHRDIGASLGLLGVLYTAQGRYTEAEPLLKRALAIWPDRLEVLNSLAKIYWVEGRYAEAKPLEQRARTIREKTRQEMQPLFRAAAVSAQRRHAQAEAYAREGRYAEAEALAKQVLAIREKILKTLEFTGTDLGPDHPDIAASLDLLAELYTAQGRYAEAEPLQKRALAIREKKRQQEKRQEARAKFHNEQAKFWARQGNLASAVWDLERALALMEKTFGPKHPEVLTIRADLATLYRAEGREQDAKRLLGARVAQDTSWEIEMGAGRRAYQQGDYAEAEKHFKVALGKTDEKAGQGTATTLHALGSVYQAQGRFAEAEPLHKRALAISEKAGGPEDTGVGVSLTHLGQLYAAQGHYAKAEPLFKRALTISEKKRHLKFPVVELRHAQILSNLAWLYAAQGRFAEAEPLYEQALALAESILNPAGSNLNNAAEQHHTQILNNLAELHRTQILNNLAELYRVQGKNRKAKRLLRKHGK